MNEGTVYPIRLHGPRGKKLEKVMLAVTSSKVAYSNWVASVLATRAAVRTAARVLLEKMV